MMAAKNDFRLPVYPIAQPYIPPKPRGKYDISNDARQRFWNYADAIQINYEYVTRSFFQLTPPINRAAQEILTDIFITKKISDDIISEDIKDKLIILMLIYKGSREFPIQFHLYSLLQNLDYNNVGWDNYFRVGTNTPKTSPWLLRPKYNGGSNKQSKQSKPSRPSKPSKPSKK